MNKAIVISIISILVLVILVMLYRNNKAKQEPVYKLDENGDIEVDANGDPIVGDGGTSRLKLCYKKKSGSSGDLQQVPCGDSPMGTVL